MPLAAGTRVGGYEIVTLIGAGGMGEVYRARDARLGRDVAIKIVSPAIAADADGLMRFEREARVLASLNHPNIAAIYGVEDHAGSPALILEFVDGETLADRIARGPLRVDEALTYAKQIADALDTAHEAGIVHRDLKPGNIKVTEAGAVKVLDFGLAKAIAAASAPDAAIDPALSPTVTVRGTQGGVILGTAAYMSPEQARGKKIDKRTDIWAFGCVLYEMLTGVRAFAGETTSDLIAAIIERAPDLSKLPASTPLHVRRMIERCLGKDPRRRARDIGDVRAELDAPLAVAPPPRRWWPPLAATIAILTIAGVAAVRWPRAAPDPPMVALALLPEAGTRLEEGIGAAIVSPDGERIAFHAVDGDGRSGIWWRAIGAVTATRLIGTEHAAGQPFWSPDSRHVGFVAESRLKRIPIAGGPVTVVATLTGGNLGATWNRDDVIVFARGNRSALYQVAASGGEAQAVTTLDSSRENSHRWPHFLPDGDHFLFTTRSDRPENNLIYVGSLGSTALQALRPALSNAVYSNGHLLFVERGTLMAQPFDARGLQLTGEPAAVVAPVHHNAPSSQGFLSASADGRVATYRVGDSAGWRLMWFDRRGAQIAQAGEPRLYDGIALSPDQQSVAFDLVDQQTGRRDVWLMHLESGTLRRLTSDPATDWLPVWSPDGTQIAFASDRAGQSTVYRKAVDGATDETLVYRGPTGAFPRGWSADRMLVGFDQGAQLAMVSADTGAAAPIPTRDRIGASGALSPDGQWIAHEVIENGSPQIYVLATSGAGRVRVSTNGGVRPRWRADGGEIYYETAAGDVMASTVSDRDRMTVLPPIKLFSLCQSTTPATVLRGAGWVNPSADGTRFLARCGELTSTDVFGVIMNWRPRPQ
jgi:Tol biopolymer transport system component